ncbi:ctenidin-1-like isoform X2 [Cherax quadricarinatus]|uniref:ctenidin-1-like isoform X2 n=1 Tax=Cherax quadricarinatus TaxID=27406 RepID=UPI00387EA53C
MISLRALMMLVVVMAVVGMVIAYPDPSPGYRRRYGGGFGGGGLGGFGGGGLGGGLGGGFGGGGFGGGGFGGGKFGGRGYYG